MTNDWQTVVIFMLAAALSAVLGYLRRTCRRCGLLLPRRRWARFCPRCGYTRSGRRAPWRAIVRDGSTATIPLRKSDWGSIEPCEDRTKPNG